MGYSTHTVGTVAKYGERAGQVQKGVQPIGEGVQDNVEREGDGRHRESKEGQQVKSTLTKGRMPPKSNGGSTHLDSKNLLLRSEDLKGEKASCADEKKETNMMICETTGEPYDPETGEYQW